MNGNNGNCFFKSNFAWQITWKILKEITKHHILLHTDASRLISHTLEFFGATRVPASTLALPMMDRRPNLPVPDSTAVNIMPCD